MEDGFQVDVAVLRSSLEQSPVTVWSGVSVGVEEPTDGQDLYLASAAERWALLTAQRGAVTSTMISPIVLSGTPALISDDGGSFAYRTLRPSPGHSDQWEFGAVGHGPDAHRTAQAMADLIGVWDRDHRTGPGPSVDLHPISRPAENLPPGRVVTKRHTHMVLNWTDTTSTR